ncbi:YdiU family protein [Marinobacterium sp. D7]|uniref:protein adenylyltransferase SelO n=1 Tax=Marinobacterium ramblicola TaxID=2849041 RepID=UPI001C2DA9A6|nr:YdiU family protein [Marinobacterium ramblicola]MBV1789530.1 YdiU family protein [Marinobacterium ramblicola]
MAKEQTRRTLESLQFDNSYARLPQQWYQRTEPAPLKGARLAGFNAEVAQLIDLDPCSVTPEQLVCYFNGEKSLPGAEPLAMKYTGHQFGFYNPDLGDGRGLLLGEVVNHKGERWDLHLKGAGRTAFSRFGDGRAVLRSTIREYLAGEAMAGLGIPTTRALCLIASEHYTQRNGMEPCALLVRVTPCHIRFGHFEYFYYSRQHDQLKLLADYSIDRYYPQCREADNPYLALFLEVQERTAELVALWQSYDFVHGVLNTDNMSILGETFDYGPYTFMDWHEPDHIANKNDDQGRYAFKRQPEIVLWNLSAFAQALVPLVPQEALEQALTRFMGRFRYHELKRMRARLGLQQEDEGDAALVVELRRLAAANRLDLARFFYHLSEQPAEELLASELGLCESVPELSEWLKTYWRRLALEVASPPIREAQMRAVNPRYILRNYMAEEVIREAHAGNYAPLNDLLPLLREPAKVDPKLDRYAGMPPDWAGAICLTCSS